MAETVNEAAGRLLAVVKAALPVLAPQKTDPKRGERALTDLQAAANALHNALNGENREG